MLEVKNKIKKTQPRLGFLLQGEVV